MIQIHYSWTTQIVSICPKECSPEESRNNSYYTFHCSSLNFVRRDGLNNV